MITSQHPSRIVRRIASTPLLALLLLGSAMAQGDEVGEARSLPPTPISVSDPPEALPVVPEVLTAEPGRDGGVPLDAPAEYGDDRIPLPMARVGRAGDAGDILLEPASGDPFYLGFAAGRYTPPPGERIDPDLVTGLFAMDTNARPHREVYAFVMFQRRMTPWRLSELESCGVRILGFHPHYCLRVAVPAEALTLVANHPAVRWVGTARAWQKIHPRLGRILQSTHPMEDLRIIINVFESDLNPASTARPIGTVAEGDPGGPPLERSEPQLLPKIWMSNGWMQRELEKRGIQIDSYLPGVHAFRASASSVQLAELLALDFVQFLEADLPIEFSHDETTPQILNDRVRASYTGGTNQVAVAGLIDTGFDVSHEALNHTFWVNWSFHGSGTQDLCGHGTYVGGTIVGEPPSPRRGWRGTAPGLGWGRNGRWRYAKTADIDPLTGKCRGYAPSLDALYATMRNSFTDSLGYTTPRPHAINCSWSVPACGDNCTGCTVFVGTENSCRITDAEVYNHNQLYVFAAANTGGCGSGTIGLEPVAKNVFTVGSVIDFHSGSSYPGELSGFSSTGPAGDGRWKPNVVAPGEQITSADAHSGSGYATAQGTSAAAPHVVGMAAQLADAYSWTRHAPHRMASLMMATATTKNNLSLATPSSSHLDRYGTGRVCAYRSVFTEADWTWSNWGFTQTTRWHYANFTVPSGASRLVVCMNYIEPAASAGASRALVKNIDLWLDRDPIDPAGNTGEYWVQQSTVDNTEIRYVTNPAAGAWRWKTWPTTSGGSARVSVTVLIVNGDTTPDQTLTLSASDRYVQPSDRVDITARVAPSDYISSSVFLNSRGISSGAALHASTTTLKDGIATNLMGNAHNGWDLLLGDINDHSPRSAMWTVSWASEGNKSFGVESISDNTTLRTASTTITVDGTAPPLPTNLHSTSHTQGAWSTSRTMSFAWNQAADNLSGIEGYGEYWTNGSSGAPGATLDFGPATTRTITVASDYPSLYYKLRVVDRSGNWTSSYAITGPYGIDTVPPSAGLVISGGNLSTTSTSVTLGITAADATSGLDAMRMRNDGGSWSPWEPVASTRSWNLRNNGGSAATGTRTVQLQVRDHAGLITQASDTIFYHSATAYFGRACAGSLSTPPGILVTGSAGIGHTFSLTTSLGLPRTYRGTLYLGISRTNWQGLPLPLDLAIVGSAGCHVNVSLDFILYSGSPRRVPVPIPLDPSLVGHSAYFQWLFTGDPTKPFVTTRGAQVVIAGA